MAIPIEIEDSSELEKWEKWGVQIEKIIEDCVFCCKPTRTWHIKTNNPCCEDCASKHTVSELKLAAAQRQGKPGR